MLQESKKIVHGVVELVNVGSKLVGKKSFFVVFQLSDEAQEIASLDVQALKAEWPSTAIRSNVLELIEVAKKKLDLENKPAQEKIEKGLGLFVKAGDLIEKGVGVYKEGVVFVGEVKALFA